MLTDPETRMTLHQSSADPTAYEARLPESLGRLRRRFSAPSQRDAILTAPEVLGLIAPRSDLPERIEIVDAFNQTLSFSRRRPQSRKNWAHWVRRFLLSLPCHLEYWHQITRPHLRAHIATLQHCATRTIELSIQPVRQTARYMAREYGLPNPAEALTLGGKPARPTPGVYLADVLEFLETLHQRPHLEAAVALQGLAGLRLTEALRLTWDKVDCDHGLVEISGETKNEASKRVIPVAARVLDALNHVARAPIQSIDNRVLIYARDYTSLSNVLGRAIRAWSPTINWQPKDLRNCILQWSVAQGHHGMLWEEYVGHAPGGITARHYIARLSALSAGESDALDERMAILRERLLAPLEAAIAQAKKPRLSNPTPAYMLREATKGA